LWMETNHLRDISVVREGVSPGISILKKGEGRKELEGKPGKKKKRVLEGNKKPRDARKTLQTTNEESETGKVNTHSRQRGRGGGGLRGQ